MTQDRTIRGVGVTTGDELLARLEPLLWSFVETVDAYCRLVQEPPYWFNERASVSLMSAAAWRIGWVAIEEYTTRKVLAERTSESDLAHRYGRCDLFAREPGGQTFAFEAKQVRARPNELQGQLTGALRAARSDASLLFAREASARIALVFAVPAFPIGKRESEPDIDRLIGELLVGVAADQESGPAPGIVDGARRATHAYVFPQKMRGCLGPAGKAYWPGVIVIAQRVKRAASSTIRTEL